MHATLNPKELTFLVPFFTQIATRKTIRPAFALARRFTLSQNGYGAHTRQLQQLFVLQQIAAKKATRWTDSDHPGRSPRSSESVHLVASYRQTVVQVLTSCGLTCRPGGHLLPTNRRPCGTHRSRSKQAEQGRTNHRNTG